MTDNPRSAVTDKLRLGAEAWRTNHNIASHNIDTLLDSAANEIEQLQAALAPFAALVDICKDHDADVEIGPTEWDTRCTVGDVRAAQSIIAGGNDMSNDVSIDEVWCVVNMATGQRRTAPMTVANARQWLRSQTATVDPAGDWSVARWDTAAHKWTEPEPEPEPTPYPWQVLAQKGCLLLECATKADAVAEVRRLDIDRPSTAPHRVCHLVEHTPGKTAVFLDDNDVALWVDHFTYPGAAIQRRLVGACRAALDQDDAAT